jgi:hypothetical protein
VYATLKKGDVYAEIDADKILKKAIWGDAYLKIASEIGASWTSQFCWGCKKLWRAEIKYDETDKNQKLTGTVKKQEGSLLTLSIKTREGVKEINGYSKGVVKKELKESALIDVVKNFMRPPIGDRSEVYQKFCKDTAQFNQALKEVRGNSWLFICPFCHANADADIQASATIALSRNTE